MHTCRASIGRWLPLPPLAPGRSVGSNPRRVLRSRRLVSSASPSADNAATESVAPPREGPTVEQLQQQMADAVAAEDFSTAAAIRDRLQALDVSQPEDVLRLRLSAAIADERFTVCTLR